MVQNIGLQRKGSSKRKDQLEAVVGSKHQGGESSRERFELSWCESRGAHLGEGMIEPQCG